MLPGTMSTQSGLIVLAGGRSQRMGRDKAWLELSGRPLVVHVVQAGLDAGLEVVVVGSPERALPSLPTPVVRVDDPAERAFDGPLRGFGVGLEHCVSRGIELVCTAACDAPWMSAAHLRFMVRQLIEYPDAAAAVPTHEEPPGGRVRLHPMCGSLRVSPAHAAVQRLLASGQRSARSLFEALQARRVPVSSLPQPRVVQGCNTPEQWAQLLETWPGHDAVHAVE